MAWHALNWNEAIATTIRYVFGAQEGKSQPLKRRPRKSTSQTPAGQVDSQLGQHGKSRNKQCIFNGVCVCSSKLQLRAKGNCGQPFGQTIEAFLAASCWPLVVVVLFSPYQCFVFPWSR